jgi:hypothetical protein
MPSFQGSGFLIGLPEGCTDASAYTFVLPPEGGYTPYITIKAERLKEPQDLKAYVSKQQASLQENVDEYAVSQYVAGQHDGMDVVLTTVEWGPEEAKVSQKIAYFLIQDDKGQKIFTLTGTDLTSQFQKTGPIFDQVFKTFTPNQIQLIEA